MTKQDWTPLAGDPMCDETMDEWASDMADRLENLRNTGSLANVARLWDEMTDDERDLMREWVAKFDLACR